MDEKDNVLATWNVYIMVSKLMSKLNRVLFVIVDRRVNAFKNGKVGIDLRMHLKDNDSVRNRGTAFRIKEIDLRDLYSNIRILGFSLINILADEKRRNCFIT